MTKNGNAFIGCSLDSKLFTREWVRYAIPYLLEHHNSVLFLIAEELLRYTRTLETGGSNFLNFSGATDQVNERKDEFYKFLKSEISKLDTETQKSISIRFWREMVDYRYTLLFRNLYISYLTIEPFNEIVKNRAMHHIQKHKELRLLPNAYYLNVAYILDEIAMSIKVTEFDNFKYEYYPMDQMDVISKLYNNEFHSFGLTIQNLINQKPSRVFSSLRLEV